MLVVKMSELSKPKEDLQDPGKAQGWVEAQLLGAEQGEAPPDLASYPPASSSSPGEALPQEALNEMMANLMKFLLLKVSSPVWFSVPSLGSSVPPASVVPATSLVRCGAEGRDLRARGAETPASRVAHRAPGAGGAGLRAHAQRPYGSPEGGEGGATQVSPGGGGGDDGYAASAGTMYPL
ncbi:hypothetical protein R6Z07F_020288 [Ovis aries]